MSLPTYQVSIDADDDHAYNEGGESIVANVIKGESFVGMEDYGLRVAPPTSCTLVVDNQDGLFSPESGNVGDVLRGRNLRLQATHNAIAYPMFTGQIVSIVPHEQQYRAVIECLGRWHGAEQRIDVPVYPSATADEIIEDALLQAHLRTALTETDGTPYLILDDPVHGLLNIASAAPQTQNYSMGAGSSIFTYFGRDYDRPTLRQVVEDATRAEWGYFVEDQSGVFRFLGRDEHQNQYTASVTLGADDLILESYAFGARIINDVTVRVSPYREEEDFTVWQSEVVYGFRPGATIRRLRFLASDGRLLALASALEHGFTFYDDSDGGNILTPSEVTYGLQTLANGAVLTVQNNTNANAYLLIGETLQATALIQDVLYELRVTNATSITRYGAAPYEINLPPFSDVDKADELANYLVGLFAAPRGLLRWIRMRSFNDACLEQQLSLNLFDMIEVDLPNLGHSANYLIVGIRQKIDQGGALHTDFYLQPQAGLWYVEIVGSSELDESTILGY